MIQAIKEDLARASGLRFFELTDQSVLGEYDPTIAATIVSGFALLPQTTTLTWEAGETVETLCHRLARLIHAAAPRRFVVDWHSQVWVIAGSQEHLNALVDYFRLTLGRVVRCRYHFTGDELHIIIQVGWGYFVRQVVEEFAVANGLYIKWPCEFATGQSADLEGQGYYAHYDIRLPWELAGALVVHLENRIAPFRYRRVINEGNTVLGGNVSVWLSKGSEYDDFVPAARDFAREQQLEYLITSRYWPTYRIDQKKISWRTFIGAKRSQR